MNADEFISRLPTAPPTSRKGRKNYLDIGFGASLYFCCCTVGSKPYGIPYLWSVTAQGETVQGRTMQDLQAFIVALDAYCKKHGVHILIYVHDTSVFFQFVRRWFVFTDVFAAAERRPLTADFTKFVHLRDCMAVSNMSLLNAARTVGVYDCPDEAFISPIYSPDSDLPQYITSSCAAESRAMSLFAESLIQRDGGAAYIPLTRTGRVRKEVRDILLYHRDETRHMTQNALRRQYQSFIAKQKMTVSEYTLLHEMSCGGLFGIAPTYKRCTVFGAVCWDRRSAYPAACMYDYVPYACGTEYDHLTEKQYAELRERFCVCARVTFHNLRHKSGATGYYLRQSRVKTNGASESGGAITYAYTLTACISELDFLCVEECYEWDRIEIGAAVAYRRTHLPDALRRIILKKYAAKEDRDSYPEPRRIAKEELLSIYGMMVTDPCRVQYPYIDDILDWSEPVQPEIGPAIDAYNSDRQRFLCYPWGIWIAAQVRRAEWLAWQACGQSWIYGDTDSAVCTSDADRIRAVFERYNTEMSARADKLAGQLGVDRAAFSPHGHLLGGWRVSETYEQFRAIGCKKYLYKTADGITAVIAGLNPDLAGSYLQKKFGLKAFDYFAENLYFPATYTTADGQLFSATGRKLRVYVDESRSVRLQDANGHICFVETESSIIQIYTPYHGHVRGEKGNEKIEITN